MGMLDKGHVHVMLPCLCISNCTVPKYTSSNRAGGRYGALPLVKQTGLWGGQMYLDTLQIAQCECVLRFRALSHWELFRSAQLNSGGAGVPCLWAGANAAIALRYAPKHSYRDSPKDVVYQQTPFVAYMWPDFDPTQVQRVLLE